MARPSGTDSAQIADDVRASTLKVLGVAGLHPGPFGQVATYLPGRKVEGVRVRQDRTEVHIVLQWRAGAVSTAAAVSAAVTALTGTPVDVYVQDVEDPARSSEASLQRGFDARSSGTVGGQPAPGAANADDDAASAHSTPSGSRPNATPGG